MARKFNKNKRHRTDDYNHDAGHAMSGNGLESAAGPGGIIPNGFTIDFDDFQDGIRPKNRYAGKGEDDVEDSTQQAPRGGLGSQVLPCALELPGDHSGEPLDGHEYLYFVRREAAKHPSIKTAEAFIKRVDEEITMEITETSITSAPSHRPSIEWRSSFLSRFSNMRQAIASSSTQPSIGDVPSHYLPIPSALDKSSWRTYINGRKGNGRTARDGSSVLHDNQSGPPGSPSMDDETSHRETLESEPDALEGSADATGRSTSAIPTQKKLAAMQPRLPIPVVLRALDHYTIISLLQHLWEWLSDRLKETPDTTTPSTVFLPPSMLRKKKKTTAFTAVRADPIADQTAAVVSVVPTVREPILPTTPLILTPLDSQWIFSLLSVLDPLLTSDEISILRGLARTCQGIADFTWREQQMWLGKGASNKDLEKYTESIGGCWMIIASVWENWGQRDLWE